SSDQKRNTPAPLLHCGFAESGREQVRQQSSCGERSESCSWHGRAPPCALVRWGMLDHIGDRTRIFTAGRQALETTSSGQQDCGPDTDLVVAWQDRKSTRLNSSHVSISYAVFCL